LLRRLRKYCHGAIAPDYQLLKFFTVFMGNEGNGNIKNDNSQISTLAKIFNL